MMIMTGVPVLSAYYVPGTVLSAVNTSSYLMLRIPQQSCYYFLFTVKGLCLRKIPPLAQGYKAS